jgi:hypothetical protein
MLCIQLPKKRWLSFGTAATKKTISYAGWDGIVFFVACRCWLFNINASYKIFFRSGGMLA